MTNDCCGGGFLYGKVSESRKIEIVATAGQSRYEIEIDGVLVVRGLDVVCRG